MTRTAITLTMLPLVLFAASPKLRLGYFGHSMFEIVLPSGIRIITDPFDLTTGPPFPTGIKADIVVMSHSHSDHAYSAGIGGSPALIAWANGSARGIDFTATPTKHFPAGAEGENHIMTWEAGGLKFNHMGDYGDQLSPEDSTVLAGSTFLFIPVGGDFTIDADQANTIINTVKPVVALPIHYKTPDHAAGFSSLATLEQANQSLTAPIVAKESWVAVDPQALSGGPVIWEPAYSADLPGDLEAKGISVIDLHPSYSVEIEVKNNTSRAADDARLILTVFDSTSLIQAETTLVSLAGGEDKKFPFGFSPPASTRYTFFGEVVYPADEVPLNDTTSTEVDLSAIAESHPKLEPKLCARWLATGSLVIVEYASPDENCDLALYEASGRIVSRFAVHKTDDGVIRWQPAEPLAQGVYFVRLAAGQASFTKKIMVLR